MSRRLSQESREKKLENFGGARKKKTGPARRSAANPPWAFPLACRQKRIGGKVSGKRGRGLREKKEKLIKKEGGGDSLISERKDHLIGILQMWDEVNN